MDQGVVSLTSLCNASPITLDFLIHTISQPVPELLRPSIVLLGPLPAGVLELGPIYLSLTSFCMCLASFDCLRINNHSARHPDSRAAQPTFGAFL